MSGRLGQSCPACFCSLACIQQKNESDLWASYFFSSSFGVLHSLLNCQLELAKAFSALEVDGYYSVDSQSPAGLVKGCHETGRSMAVVKGFHGETARFANSIELPLRLVVKGCHGETGRRIAVRLVVKGC